MLLFLSHQFSFSKQFYTSSKIEKGKAFEVNRRVVLAARNIGVGHHGLVKFSAVMNMMTPMHENSYRDHVKAICNAAKTVAKRSMENAVEELKEFYEPEEDGFHNVGISADGTWRKRGFSLLFRGMPIILPTCQFANTSSPTYEVDSPTSNASLPTLISQFSNA